MKQLMRQLGILGIVILGAFPSVWAREFDYAAYIQTTIRKIIVEAQNYSIEGTDSEKYNADIQLECRVVKYKVPCSYSSKLRFISEKKKNMIMMWLETLQIDLMLASLYQQEIQITEGIIEYWIPIQEQIIPHMKAKLAKNDTIELYMIYIGKVESELVFIATEFEKPIFSPVKNMHQTTAHAAP